MLTYHISAFLLYLIAGYNITLTAKKHIIKIQRAASWFITKAAAIGCQDIDLIDLDKHIWR